VRLIPSPHPACNAAPWSATLGLAALLAFTATAWWRLGVAAAGGDAPAAAPVTDASTPAPPPLRLTVAADGSVSIAGAAVKPEELASRVKPPAGATPTALELAVDPRAPGAAVDDLLTRLRDAGVSRCTLVVDSPPTAKGATP
jgi:biopolymer transport protein ExbD